MFYPTNNDEPVREMAESTGSDPTSDVQPELNPAGIEETPTLSVDAVGAVEKLAERLSDG